MTSTPHHLANMSSDEPRGYGPVQHPASNSDARKRQSRDPQHTEGVLSDVVAERIRQDRRWGQQNHPNGTGHDPTGFRVGLPAQMPRADEARFACEHAFSVGRGAWRDILVEEVAEALEESDPKGLREELIQVAAVAVAWVEKIDRDSAVSAS